MALLPLTLINASILVITNAIPFHFVILELTIVLHAIDPIIPSDAMEFPVTPHSFVFLTVQEIELSSSLWIAFFIEEALVPANEVKIIL